MLLWCEAYTASNILTRLFFYFTIFYFFLFAICLLHRGHFLSIRFHEFVKVFRSRKQGAVSLILVKCFVSF